MGYYPPPTVSKYPILLVWTIYWLYIITWKQKNIQNRENEYLIPLLEMNTTLAVITYVKSLVVLYCVFIEKEWIVCWR